MDIVKSPHTKILPTVINDQVDINSWILSHGLPFDSFTVLPLISPEEVSEWMRNSDVAVFTNRAEGGTNLVAMEALASGVPVVLSANTGHLDLVYSLNGRKGCFPIFNQKEVIINGEEYLGWGETSVEDVLSKLDEVFHNRPEAEKRAQHAAEVFLHILIYILLS